ncbi:MAG TPA: hypothetical protein VD813_14195 [Pseudonocardia sp.]|nr:hypothetical protein [Pseudonocardia sp.]
MVLRRFPARAPNRHRVRPVAPRATGDFPGFTPGQGSLQELRAVVGALRDDDEFDIHRLLGLLKVAAS